MQIHKIYISDTDYATNCNKQLQLLYFSSLPVAYVLIENYYFERTVMSKGTRVSHVMLSSDAIGQRVLNVRVEQLMLL